MNNSFWGKLGRLKNFDSNKSEFFGHCHICEQTLEKGKEIVIIKNGLRKWIRIHNGLCLKKIQKLLEKERKLKEHLEE
ncbi:MAG: hypothetical protein HOF41_02430 [Candidatus Marinimicrobia bacterium]|jgi:hypothetical protein|nr:hypothetical protein [Candidatus Neomarinimicrobiota bacterium]